MARPRRIPPTAYPTAAIQVYYTALNQAVVAWFQALFSDLSQVLGLRLDDTTGGLCLDSRSSLVPSRFRQDADGDFFEVDAQLQQALARLRNQSERLARHARAKQVEGAMDTARTRWQALDQQLQQAAGNMIQSVNRLSQRNVDAQIQAALTDRRLRVTVGDPPFGVLQAPIERAARANALLIKDIGEKAARDVEALVQDAVSRGLGAEHLRPLLQRRLDVTRTRAALIARHQTARLESELSVIRGEAAGAEAFEWLRTHSAHPRKDHLDQVGKIYPLSHRPLPREEINCQCSMRLVWDALAVQIARTKAANERLKRQSQR